jgi:hypothetical protein
MFFIIISGRQQESITILKAALNFNKLLMMGGKPARNIVKNIV